MTPGARVQAAIELLDLIGDGEAADKALLSWARRSRYAGSGDRAAVRDHVFQALRCWRSYACLGGGETGRGRMIGALRDAGLDPAELFSGIGYAPAPLSEAESASGASPDGNAVYDLPDWLMAEFRASLGDGAETAAMALRERAPVMLRINSRHSSRDEVVDSLAEDGIKSAPHPIATTAIRVTDGARRVARSRAYVDGVVELQDGSGQAAIEGLDLTGVRTVLDYCAGGGGKSLALAARSDAQIFAHDIDPERMQDLPERAARAGVQIEVLETSDLRSKAPFDLVLCDAPCSGSGTWRRSPEAKWCLTPERLNELVRLQAEILNDAATLVAPGGRLVYSTCSVLKAENEESVKTFLNSTPDWICEGTRSFDISDGGDGFFVATMTRVE